MQTPWPWHPITSSNTPPITIESLLRNPTYKEKNILEKLLMHQLQKDRQRLLTNIDHTLSAQDQTWVEKAYHDYTVAQQPIEYILGKVTFWGQDFKVTPATLIPRPETEYMIEAVRERLHTVNQAPVLIDLGTGCGVLWLSTLMQTPIPLKHAFLTDYAQNALLIAQENEKTYHASIMQRNPWLSLHRLHADLLDHATLQQNLPKLSKNESLLIVANLPYIPEAVFEEQVEPRVKQREPKMAFVGGDDGLDLYRKTLDQLLDLSLPNTTTLFLEMMTRQWTILREEYPTLLRSEVKTFHMNIRIIKCHLQR